MELGLKDKRALVTGGSHGIGLAILNLLREEGCDVHSISRREGFDVLNPDDMERVLATFKDIDILINNVGGGGRWGTQNPLGAEEGVWSQVYEKNAVTAMRFTMTLLPYMLTQKWGRVVTIASIYGREGGGRPWFNMAKAAEISLMKCLALHYKDSGVTFNSVAPGLISISGIACEGKGGTPEDVANLVVFLCSEKASLISGACIAIDGGEGRSF